MHYALVLALMLSPSAAGSADDFKTAYDKGFRASYIKEFVAQCVPAAKEKAPNAPVDFAVICQCAADELIATKSVEQLSKGLPDDEEGAVVRTCVKSYVAQHALTCPKTPSCAVK